MISKTIGYTIFRQTHKLPIFRGEKLRADHQIKLIIPNISRRLSVIIRIIPYYTQYHQFILGMIRLYWVYIYIIDYIQDIRLYPGNNQYIRTLSESIRTGNPRFLISLLDSRWIEAIWLITSMPGKSTMARSMASWMCLDLLKVSSVAV